MGKRRSPALHPARANGFSQRHSQRADRGPATGAWDGIDLWLANSHDRRFDNSPTRFHIASGTGTILSRPMRSRSKPAKVLSDLIWSSVTGLTKRLPALMSTTTICSFLAFGSAYGFEATFAYPTAARSVPVW